MTIAGRVERICANGIEPDAGARVMVIPQRQIGSAPIDSAGWGPGEAPSAESMAQLAKAGGVAAVANAEGEFSLPAPREKIWIVVVSAGVRLEVSPPERQLLASTVTASRRVQVSLAHSRRGAWAIARSAVEG